MSIDHSREVLKQSIISDEPFSPERCKRVAQLALDWFHDYKDWEEDDRFIQAIQDNRMCISQRGEDTVIGAGDPAYLGVKDQDNQGGRSQKALYKTLTYRTGVDSLKQRLDPANFGDAKDGAITRLKYKLGLHDLSASLMNKDKPQLENQFRWDLLGLKKDWPIVFMPLPKTADLVVFNLLSGLNKEWRAAGELGLDATLGLIRRRMTRVKLAQDSDMGAGLINVNPAGSGDPNQAKFRYGLADIQSELRGNSWVPVHRPGISLIRKAKALEYQSILATQVGSSNEIVVAFRQHANPRFPIISLWTGKGCQIRGDAAGYIKDGFIPNDWADTVER